ncbi:hypothetical protein [Antribacter gilvus]|uniref:hypothetical protein n=1 Tax=Antribacter gilvus TaxID=2304675 RepID=UPI000F78E099|nr:hypothetical protein [Antribacter gilvus]
MRRKYLIACLVSTIVSVVAGPFISILTWRPTPGAGVEDDVWPMGLMIGWVLFSGPLTAIVLVAALLGEALAQQLEGAATKMLIVSSGSAVILLGGAACLSALSGGLGPLPSTALVALPGWLIVGVGPRLLRWIDTKDAGAGFATDVLEDEDYERTRQAGIAEAALRAIGSEPTRHNG